MPRCKDGGYCIDDLCHNGSVTLCGLYWFQDLSESGEWMGEDDDYDPEYDDEPSRSLVVLAPGVCPVDGSTLSPDGMEEPALFKHGGYGATRRTVVMFCPACGWSITREVSAVSPR